MRDALEEQLAERLGALGETVGDELPPPVDLESQVLHRRRSAHAARRWSTVGIAAAIVATLATVAVVHGTTGRRGTLRIATSSTTAVPVHDALQPGTVMLSARGRFVISLNALGHQNATMVSTNHGDITFARVTADHRALWYLSSKDGPRACGEVVRANIDGNSSNIVSKAVAFDISPDGTRLALYGAGNLADGRCAPVKSGSTGQIAVVDIATFETSKLSIGNVTSLRWSPDGSYLVVATCPEQGCAGLARIDVPARLGRPLGLRGVDTEFSPNPIRSQTLAFGPDGLYALARTASTQTVERYDARTLVAPVPVFRGTAGWDVTQVVPATDSTYVVATPRRGSSGLYRIAAGKLSLVRLLPDPGTLTPVTPLPGG